MHNHLANDGYIVKACVHKPSLFTPSKYGFSL
jgi:hypothetical protein